jgi:hypothetical protein
MKRRRDVAGSGLPCAFAAAVSKVTDRDLDSTSFIERDR